MWKLTIHKSLNGYQDTRVRILVKEIATYSIETYAEAFENHFKARIIEIPRTNNFSANLLYRCKQVNFTTVEIWKMKADGDFKEKVFTVEFGG